jgi:peptidoglycan hydrolase CwlO-like protein
MIFVILGTQDKSFIRLLKEIENLKKALEAANKRIAELEAKLKDRDVR